MRDSHTKFPVIKNMENLSADHLVLAYDYFFSVWTTRMKIMSDASGNFISEKSKELCKEN